MKIGIAMAVVGVMSTTIDMNPAYAYTYGALAAGSCERVVGRGYTNLSQEKADMLANAHCAADNCEIVARIKGGCTALAVSPGRCHITGKGDGPSRKSARVNALQVCNQNFGAAGNPCKIRADLCPSEQ